MKSILILNRQEEKYTTENAKEGRGGGSNTIKPAKITTTRGVVFFSYTDIFKKGVWLSAKGYVGTRTTGIRV